MIDPNADRRRQPRIRPQAYAYKIACVCAQKPAEAPFNLDLVDISPGGARFHWPSGGCKGRFSMDQALVCSIPDKNGAMRLKGLRCRVRWIEDSQIGVLFDEDIELSLGELQDLFV